VALLRTAVLRLFFVEDVPSRNIPPDLAGRVFRKLQMIDDATTDQDPGVAPSDHFEKLRGRLAGRCRSKDEARGGSASPRPLRSFRVGAGVAGSWLDR